MGVDTLVKHGLFPEVAQSGGQNLHRIARITIPDFQFGCGYEYNGLLRYVQFQYCNIAQTALLGPILA
jgi:hypothetical protein